MYSIAIDGPVCSGKSTIADELAKKLNILHLNTGALYRAIGLYAYNNGLAKVVDENNIPVLSNKEKQSLINNVQISVKFDNCKQLTILNGEDVSDKLYSPVMSDYSSRVSAIPEVRNHILNTQREIAKQHNVVMEGRDITSHVLPHSKYKFYITADVMIRAHRRYEDNISKGLDVTFEETLKDIEIRDSRDMHRSVCPLVQTKDSVVIDTSSDTIEQSVNKMMKYIKE